MIMMTKKNFLLVIVTSIFFAFTNVHAQDDLFKACMQGDFEGVKSAVEAGADVNALDANGNTPIAASFCLEAKWEI